MAHNLNEERMFYTGQVPWHGLGTHLENPATAREAIEASRLAYPLELQQINTHTGIFIPDHKAVVRTDNNTVLGIVGNRYKIIDNVEAFNFFDVLVGEGQAIYHTAGALGKGERIWILAKLPNNIILNEKDIIERFLLLVNSHDGTSTLRMFFTPIRVVCYNTLNMALKARQGEGIAIRHTANYKSKIEQARQILGISIDYYRQFETIAKQFDSVTLTISEVEEYFNNLLDIDIKDPSTRALNQRQELIALYKHGKGVEIGNPETLWKAYNAVTEYTDHHRTVKNLDKDPTNKLNSIWFGSGANLKQKAYNQALELVKVKGR